MPSPGYERRRAARVAARRRLAFLLIVTVAGSGAMAELRGGPWIAVQACADVLFVGGFVHLRHGVRAEQRRARLAAKRRARLAEAAPAVPAPTAPVRVAPARVAPRRVVVPPAAARVAEAARAVERLAPAVGSSAGTVQVGRLSRPATAENNSGYGDPMHTAQHRAPAAATSRSRTAAPTPAAKAPAGRRTVDLTQPGRWTEEHAAGRTEDWRPSRLLDDEVEDTSVVLREAEDGYEDRLTEGMDAFDAIFRKAASG